MALDEVPWGLGRAVQSIQAIHAVPFGHLRFNMYMRLNRKCGRLHCLGCEGVRVQGPVAPLVTRGCYHTVGGGRWSKKKYHKDLMER